MEKGLDLTKLEVEASHIANEAVRFLVVYSGTSLLGKEDLLNNHNMLSVLKDADDRLDGVLETIADEKYTAFKSQDTELNA